MTLLMMTPSGARVKCRVVACDPFPRHDKAAEIGFEYMDFDDVLAHSDILSLHCPLVESTQHLINDASIAKMKPGMIIINTSRGGLVDTGVEPKTQIFQRQEQNHARWCLCVFALGKCSWSVINRRSF